MLDGILDYFINFKLEIDDTDMFVEVVELGAAKPFIICIAFRFGISCIERSGFKPVALCCNADGSCLFMLCRRFLHCKSTGSWCPTVNISGIVLPHEPVLVNEVVHHLSPLSGQTFIDFTFGSGGHTRALLNACQDIKIFCIDRDPVAYDYAKELSNSAIGRVFPIQGRLSESMALLIEAGCPLGGVDGIVMDLGASSMQMDSPERGFGLSRDSPLDMRMSWHREDSPTAADVLNNLSAPHLAQIFKTYGEERFARRIANAVVECRSTLGPLRSTRQLADLVTSVVTLCQGQQSSRKKPTSLCDGDNDGGGATSSHVATRVFQALRIFVNDELNELCVGLEVAHRLLRGGGRAAIISFHSLEDRLVKRAFNNVSGGERFLATKLADTSLDAVVCGSIRRHRMRAQIEKGPWNQLTGPISPSDFEVCKNRRSRSAKLRVGEKLS